MMHQLALSRQVSAVMQLMRKGATLRMDINQCNKADSLLVPPFVFLYDGLFALQSGGFLCRLGIAE